MDGLKFNTAGVHSLATNPGQCRTKNRPAKIDNFAQEKMPAPRLESLKKQLMILINPRALAGGRETNQKQTGFNPKGVLWG